MVWVRVLVKMRRMLLFLLLLLLLLLLLMAGGGLNKRVEVWLLLMLALVLHTRLNGNQVQRRLRSQRACFGGLSHDWEFN